MSRAKKKRIHANRRKQARRNARLLTDALFSPGVSALFLRMAYEYTQDFMVRNDPRTTESLPR
jgi:hypothetical protein